MRGIARALRSRRGIAASLALFLVAALVVAGLRHRRVAEAPLVAGQVEEKEDAEEPASAADTVSDAAIISALQQDFVLQTPKKEETVLSEPHRELLERLQRDLLDPAKRLAAVVDLYEATGAHRIWVSSSGYLDAEPGNAMLRKRAAELFASYERDPRIVRQLLDSDREPLQQLGQELWVNNASKAREAGGRPEGEVAPKPLPAAEEVWHAMAPRLRALAEKSPHAFKAITGLTFYRPENDDFLRGLLARDKSPWKVSELVRTTIEQEEDRDPLFNVQMLRLLNDPDVEVRKAALAFVWGNQMSAEWYWVDFSPAVVQRIEKLRTSPSRKERESAEYSIEALAKMQAGLAKRREAARKQASRRSSPQWPAGAEGSAPSSLLPPAHQDDRVAHAPGEPANAQPEAASSKITLNLPETLEPFRLILLR